MKKLLENKIFKAVYGIFKAIVMTFLVVYLLFVIIQRLTNNSAIFGYHVFTVATGSMEPLYMVNDVILVEEVDINTLKVGDDVAYIGASSENKGIIITHRIIEIRKNDKGEDLYILQGINNDYEDPAIYGHQILGEVRGKVFIINTINHLVKNIYGFFFLVFCPLVLVIFLEIADTIIEIKVENNEIRLKNRSDDDQEEENNVNNGDDEVLDVEEDEKNVKEEKEEILDTVEDLKYEEEII